MNELKRCVCGWERPLISVTTLDGSLPPSSIVPVYNCPRCGTSYVPNEIPEEIARRILRDLMSSQRPS
jgi:hypothetical protein